MTVGSLFSGIGGLDLGLERAGMEVIWQSEIEPYACRVLKKHWPQVPNIGNVKEVNWHELPRPDVIAGGYPCQPFSLAGQRAGEEDPRHLWPYVAAAIRVLRPRFAVLENVRGHLSLGFGTVLGDLAECGYDAQWQVIPARAAGAPQRRDRVFIVAHRQSEPFQEARPLQLPTRPSFELGGGAWASPPGTAWEDDLAPVAGVADGVPHRVDRIRGLGNAVVPQVAELVGRAILEAAA